MKSRHSPSAKNPTCDIAWHYHSEAPEDSVPGTEDSPPPPALEPAAAVTDEATHFQISVKTEKYRPNHLITLRTDVDGWARDIHGSYWWDDWRFVLPKSDYRKGCTFKFLLNGAHWQRSKPFKIKQPKNTHLVESQVTFPELPEEEERFVHQYENLRVSDDLQQQNLVRARFSEEDEWDVIVIGSGMGGGVLADALSDYRGKQLKVLVLDAGSLDYPTHIYNLPATGIGRFEGGNKVRHYDKVDNDDPFGDYVQMNLGGRSVYWSGLIPRMRHWEMRHWPKSVEHYLSTGGYERAEKLMRKQVTGGKFQEKVVRKLARKFPMWTVVNTPRSLHQPEFGTERDPFKHPESFLFHSTGAFSAAELLLNSMTSGADPGRGLHVNLNHLVMELIHDGRRVSQVVCQDLAGNCVRRYRGKYVVLAAGSLESVKIALQSELKDPSGKVGVGLTDHPSYYAPDGWKGGDTFYIRSRSEFAGPHRHARIFLYPDEPWQGHWFNVEIVINGHYWHQRHADDDVVDALDSSEARSTIGFKFVFASPIQEENFVKLPGRNKRLIVRHAANPSGGEAREAVLTLLKKLIDFFDVEPPDLTNPGNCHFGNGGTVHHAGATLRMTVKDRPGADGKDEVRQGVVDENLKFEAYENLYVCDPSVYPFIPAANPSLTLAALALRLADHLGEKLS